MRTIQVYRTYNFTDKDPVIDELRTMTKDADINQLEAARKAGLSTGTVQNWFYGKVRRPQSASVEAYGRALGFKRVWKKM